MSPEPSTYTARLVTSCQDRPGIVAAVSGHLHAKGANITSSHQYSTDAEGGRFFLRTEFFLPAGALGAPGGPEAQRAFEESFAEHVADMFAMSWKLSWKGRRQRLAILVSREEHCLQELLWRWQRGELDAEVVCVISNHRDLERDVGASGLPFHHVPVREGRRGEAEDELLDLLRGEVDVVVLARYMQILSGTLLERVGAPMINIHHSFLPAFAGARPYVQAHDRGVKLIGATAHYVTEELDAGPIIEQDVVRVDHELTAAELARVGRDVERLVLARAVRLHLADRVLVDGRRTIVF